MPLALDHIVIAVADLDKAFADYTALGFTVIRGGEHANGITHNVLVVFQDGAYLELIGWKKPEPGNRWSDIFHSHGEGFVDHALLPDDIVGIVSRAQARGLDIADPIPGGRNRPDGQRLEWQTARSPKPDVPFLCGDVTPRAGRVQEGEVRWHSNGVTGVGSLTIAVNDADVSAKRYAALLGGDTPVLEEGTVGDAPARTALLRLANGTNVVLASPLGAEGELAKAIAERGEGPFAAVFTAGGGEPRRLEPALTHGARLSVA